MHYSDDGDLDTQFEEDIQAKMHLFSSAFTTFGLIINLKKMKVKFPITPLSNQASLSRVQD